MRFWFSPARKRGGVNVRRLGGCVLIAMGLGMAASVTPAAAQLSLTVSTPSPLADNGTARARLRLGLLPGATDGFDTRWDMVAPAAPSSTVALAAGIQQPAYPPGRRSLVWDFRSETFPQEWNIEIASDQSAPITLAWTPPDAVAAPCASIAWTLFDTASGSTVDMASGTNRSYQNSAGGKRQFVVRATASAITSPPPVPFNLWIPRQGRGSVYLAWSGPRDPALRYHVYREDGLKRVRITTSPQNATSYLDTGLDGAGSVTYRVTAVDAQGCESPEAPGAVVAPRR